ncbi:MAG: hypothetical protein RR235_07960 [Oscillospiraceae bacterium]
MKNNYGITAKLSQYFKRAIADGKNISVGGSPHEEEQLDSVYIISDFIAVKIPALFYPAIAQGFTLRECPKPGESFIVSGRIQKTGAEWESFWSTFVKPCDSRAFPTPYSVEQDGCLLRIFTLNSEPLLIQQKFLDCFEWTGLEFLACNNLSAVRAVGQFCEVLFQPMKSCADSKSQAAIAKEFSAVHSLK